ncbi:MAG: hypothetical protein JNK30_21450 [Phenylobacterium sp.]|uniref:hypothetical protein n=1 Tax=Phenylobacterium sp. TaxID=1871053 RepID=UPI001A546ECF|nr:hypothetical protein [Phenylobacterium sp.]MBL8773966.1 hypothetical protein [Phenylobacterium sp.]
MYVTTVASAAYPIPVTPVRATGGVTSADYATRMAEFDRLSAAVNDTSGRTAEAQRVEAYQALQAMSARGDLAGIDPDRRKVLDRATYDSDIGRRAQDLGRDFVQAMNAARQAGGPGAALEAVAARFDDLSASDRDLLFRTTINVADRNGTKPYADPSAWRANMDAQARVVAFMKDAGVVGANGALDQKAAQARAAADPKFAAALRLSMRSDNNSPEWTQAVFQVFGRAAPQDEVRLSEAARAALDAMPAAPSTAAPAAAPYRQGSIASTTA